jgi:hypothetical protein
MTALKDLFALVFVAALTVGALAFDRHLPEPPPRREHAAKIARTSSIAKHEPRLVTIVAKTTEAPRRAPLPETMRDIAERG